MSVSEDKVPGEEVGRLKAKDPDMGDNGMVNYKLIDGDGMNMFEMSTDSETREAVIKLKKVRRHRDGDQTLYLILFSGHMGEIVFLLIQKSRSSVMIHLESCFWSNKSHFTLF